MNPMLTHLRHSTRARYTFGLSVAYVVTLGLAFLTNGAEAGVLPVCLVAVVAAIVDTHRLFSLVGLIPWGKLSTRGRVWVALLLLATWPIALAAYLVRAWQADLGRGADLELAHRIATLEREAKL